jgi:hypothetical protein
MGQSGTTILCGVRPTIAAVVWRVLNTLSLNGRPPILVVVRWLPAAPSSINANTLLLCPARVVDFQDGRLHFAI